MEMERTRRRRGGHPEELLLHLGGGQRTCEVSNPLRCLQASKLLLLLLIGDIVSPAIVTKCTHYNSAIFGNIARGNLAWEEIRG